MKVYLTISMVVFALISSIAFAKAGYDDFENVEFSHVVSCLKEDKPLEVKGKKYVFIEEPSHHAVTIGTLLKKSDIEKLPEQVRFFFVYKSEMTHKDFGKLVTICFTSNNNPDWSENFNGGPHGDPTERYWHQEHSKDVVGPVRSIHFLAREIEEEK